MTPVERSQPATESSRQVIEALQSRVSEIETHLEQLHQSKDSDPAFAPPTLAKINAPKDASEGKSKGQEKGYGFIKLEPQQLKVLNTVGIPLDQIDKLESEAKTRGLFVYAGDVKGASGKYSIGGLDIVPQKVELTKKGFAITDCSTEEEYRSNKRREVIRNVQSKLNTTRQELRATLEPVLQEQILKALKEEGFTTLSAEELGRIATDRVRYGYNTDGSDSNDIGEKVSRALHDGKYKESLNLFDVECTKPGGYLERANLLQEQLQSQYGIKVVVHEHRYGNDKIGSLSVEMVLEDKTHELNMAGYETACQVDCELAFRNIYSIKTSEKYIGMFSGEQVKYSGNWGDAFVSESYADREPASPTTASDYYTDNKLAPQKSDVVWKVMCDPTKNIDSIDVVAQITENLKSQTHWQKAGLEAHEYLQQLKEDEANATKEKQDATQFIQELVRKLRIPSASPDNPITTEWLGMKVEAKAWHDHTGTRGGHFINHSCELTLQDGSSIDLARPDDWPSDVRGAAKQIKEAWKNDQPEGAVVENETKDEAISRLVNFPYDPEILNQTIPGFHWETSYREANLFQAYHEDGRDSYERFIMPISPNIKVPDRDDSAITHRLFLTGPNMDSDVEVGTIVFFPSQKAMGFYGEVGGPQDNVFSSPHYVISDYLKENPDVDPRLVRLEWRKIAPIVAKE